MEDRKNSSSLGTPIAIVVAGFMIATAVYISNSQTGLLSGADKPEQLGEVAGVQQAAQPSAQPNPTNNPAQPTEPLSFKVSIDDDPVMGDPNAPVTLIEFSDYRCPFCSRFDSDTLTQLKTEYIDTGKLKFVYRDFSIHAPQSDDASTAGNCALEQNKFWEYQKVLWERFDAGDTFDAATLKSYAGQLGLNQATFDSCFDAGNQKAEFEKDYNDARLLSVTGTPTFFVGKTTSSGEIEATKIVGAQPYETFKTEIDKLLK